MLSVLLRYILRIQRTVVRPGLLDSRVAGLANFSPRVSGLKIKLCGFRVLQCVVGCGFGHFLCSDFEYFTKNSYFVGISKSFSPCS